MIYRSAIEFYNESLSLSEPMDAKSRMITSYKGMAEAYKRLGRYRTALDFYKKQSDLKDLVNIERNARKITEIETNYQIQQREKEIEILKKESEIQVLNLTKNRTVTYFLLGGSDSHFCTGFCVIPTISVQDKIQCGTGKPKQGDCQEKYRHSG